VTSEEFIKRVSQIVDFWEHEAAVQEGGPSRLEGVAFSLLVALDEDGLPIPDGTELHARFSEYRRAAQPSRSHLHLLDQVPGEGT
jgi:hypothetical protein